MTKQVSTQFMELSGQLVQTAKELDRKGFYTRSFFPPSAPTLETEARNWLVQLLAHFLLADGVLKEEELTFLNAVTSRTLTPEAGQQALEQERQSAPDFLKQLPHVVRAAVSCDRAQNTRAAITLINAAETLAGIVVAADRDISPREATALADYKRRFRGAVHPDRRLASHYRRLQGVPPASPRTRDEAAERVSWCLIGMPIHVVWTRLCAPNRDARRRGSRVERMPKRASRRALIGCPD